MSDEIKKYEAEGGNVRVTMIPVGGAKGGLEEIEKRTEARTKEVGEPRSGGGEQPWLEPPYSPEVLFMYYENSTALRPCIDAYATNIDGFGHRLVQKYTETQIKEALWNEVERRYRDEEKEPPPDEQVEREVDAAYEEQLVEVEAERDRLNHFFEYACPGSSFIELRKRTRVEKEICGFGFWEVVRDPETGHPAKLYHAPSRNIRLMPVRETVVRRVREQVNALDFIDVPVRRRVRTFVQRPTHGGPGTYFKEFGDDRTVSATTGRAYKDMKALRQAEGDDAPEATELVYFAIYNGTSPYGVPRWVGALKAVLGSFELDDVNYGYFKHKAVPPMMIFVSGHTKPLTAGAIKVIKNALRDAQGRGTEGFHEVPVIEAMQDPEARLVPQVHVERLADQQWKEAIHQEYDKRNIEKVGYAFRIPKILRGDMTDFNRATATAALEYAETQVFAGERAGFDNFMNLVFLPALDVRYHRFVSMGPQVKDLDNVSEAVARLSAAGTLTPEEARRYITDNTTLDLDVIDEPWTKRPLAITQSGRGFEPVQKRGAAAAAEGWEAVGLDDEEG